MFAWVVFRPWGTLAPGNQSGPLPAVTPPSQPLPRPGQINIYLEKAKVRMKNLSSNSTHLLPTPLA